MKRKHVLLFLSFLLSISACKTGNVSTTTKSNETQPIIARFGDKTVTVQDFEYVYKKNNGSAEDAFSERSIRDYLDLYMNFRLKVREAEAKGMDTTQSFKNELDGYKNQLAQPYLTEKGVSDKLCKEAYERMKEEVSATHILINLDPLAGPADTLKAWNKLIDIRNQAINGKNFGELALQYSQDPSAKNNKGYLGYFTALQMVYPFEDAAFNTPVGQISMPVRTKFGYHILKVEGKRPSSGQVKVAHIMIRATAGMPALDSIEAKKKIEEIYKKLNAGEAWDVLVNQFSEDANSKPKNGELNWFSVGKMIPSFEDAAFKLKEKGAYSAPVQTPYGWHIIKLTDKKSLETYAELENTIKAKVAKDSRSDLNKTLLYQRLKKENQFTENTKIMETVIAKADSSIYNGKFKKKLEDKENLVLCTIKDQNYTINDFYSYITKTAPKNGVTVSPQDFMRALYKNWVNEINVKFEEAHLSEKYLDYRMLYKEYRDGILLFALMDDQVWSQAIEDTTGLKNYFAANNASYTWKKRAKVTIYNVQDEKILEEVKKQLAIGVFEMKDYTVSPLVFEKNSAAISSAMKKQLESILPGLIKDKTMTIAISLSSAFGENSYANRVDSLKAFFKEKNIAPDRLTFVHSGNAPKRKTEQESDRAAQFKFYSKSLKVLESNTNKTAPLALKVTEGLFQKGENAVVDTMKWEVGTQLVKTANDSRINYVSVQAIEDPRPKKLEECKGLVISDYQNYLEKQWIVELRKKYPVAIVEEEVKKMIKK